MIESNKIKIIRTSGNTKLPTSGTLTWTTVCVTIESKRREWYNFYINYMRRLL